MIKKVLVLLGSAVIIAVGAVWISYALWRSDTVETLASNSEVVETAKGPMEYRMYGESGPVALFIHGTPGGYDQYSPAQGDSFSSFRLLVLSRPGYLRTPLEVGRTPAEQADAYAALLDALDIERVVVVGASGGAPSAISFAANYPERTLALVGFVPLSQPEVEQERSVEPSLLATFFSSDFGRWLMLEKVLSDEDLAKRMLDEKVESRVLGNPERLHRLRTLARATLPSSLRKAGADNDSSQKAALGSLPVDRVAVPTLIVHGTNDHNVEYQQSVALVKRVPGAELFTIAGGDHFVLVTHQEEIAGRLKEFWQTVPGVHQH